MKLTINNLHSSLTSPSLDKVSFLNEISSLYPHAISFASGRPSGDTYNVKEFVKSISTYINHVAKEKSISHQDAWISIGNYASAKGIINNILQKMIKTDENMDVNPETIVITTGAQEAISLSLHTLCQPEYDVLIIMSPFYSGIDGAAKIFNIPTHYVTETEHGVNIDELNKTIDEIKNDGKKPKALYCTPNYSNPSGNCMSTDNRLALLKICHENGIIIIEDNTYGLISWRNQERPLKSLDENKTVLYISSFSKSIFPGLRIGYIVADQVVKQGNCDVFLADCIAKVKSMTSNNTSHISQAMLGGFLIDNNFSVRLIVADKVKIYQNNLDKLHAFLDHHIGHIPNIFWSNPSGGFFILLKLPFLITEEDQHISTQQFGVIFTPCSVSVT